jgi:membrane-associated PAP2 superfamily phosphatase
MPLKVKTSWLLKYLLTLLLVFFSCNIIACSQNLQSLDFVDAKTGLSDTLDRDSVRYNKPSASFNKTDSAFSFQSPRGYIPSIYYNFAEQITAPFKFKTKQWIITGAAVGITVTLIRFDNDIDLWATVQKQKHNWVNKSSPVISQFGNTYGISSVAAIGLISAAFKKQKGVQTSLLATQALITSAAWVQLIKHLTGREDPSASYVYSKKAGGQWWGPFAQYDQDLPVYKSVSSFDAFPSGHTAAAFSIATVFASQYDDIKAIPIISYSMATLVGVSRLTEHAHWASDVFVGGLIGYVCGKQVVDRFKKTHQNPSDLLSSDSKIKPEFTFFQNGNQAGLLIRW